MAVFTAVATTALTGLVGGTAIFGSATLFTLAVGVVATGLAVGTAKLFGVYSSPRGKGNDPGVKVQLPPATDNKIPRLYGTNYAGGIITDVEIKNQNQTMAYCLVLSEFSPGENWSVAEVYRNDKRFNFGAVSPFKVVSETDSNDETNLEIENKIRVRVYAGGSNASNQIFPTTNQVPAFNTTSATDTGQIARWTSANTMENLVFAVYEIDYDPENDLTGLDNIQFLLTNSRRNPADVLEDYLLNSVWGARLSSDLVDSDSIQQWREYCDEPVDYIDINGDPQTHPRWRTDGALSTFNDVNENISKICISGSAWFTYDPKLGKFGVTINRKATESEKSEAFEVSDNNIVSDIKITGTDLFRLHNSLEVEYASVEQRDQTEVFYADIDPAVRNPNEPDNSLSYRLDMVNSRPRVANLSIQDLNQSRISTVVEFTLDFSGLNANVGELMKLTSDLYGYSDKLFRIIRLNEREAESGVITVKVVALEYLDAVYGDLIVQDDLPAPVTGVTNFFNTPELRALANTAITRGVVTAINDDIPEYTDSLPPEVIGLDANAVQDINELNSVILPQLNSDLGNLESDLFILNTETLPQLESDLGNVEADLITLNTVTLPNLESDLNNTASNVNILSTQTLPALESDLGNLEGNLNTLNNQTIPALQSDLSNTASNVNTLSTVTIPNLESDLSNTASNVNTLNTVTIPALQSDLGNLDGNLTTLSSDLTQLEIDLAQLDTDLSNSFPVTETNIANNAISAPKIQTNAITAIKVAANAIVAGKIAVNAVTANTISANAVTTAKIAANAVTANEIAANTITATQIAAGAITANEIQANTITSAEIAVGAITANEIAANAVTAVKIEAGAVNADKISANAVTSAKIAAGAVTANEIAANAVTAVKILAGSVNADKIAANAVTAVKIQAGAVNADKIAANTITAAQIATNAITANEIAANTITAGQIATNAITANEISANAVIAGKIAVNAVTADTISANAVTSVKIAANAVTANEIAANTITAGQIATNAVTANEIAANTITAAQIATNTITANEILTGTITANEISTGTITADKLVSNFVYSQVVSLVRGTNRLRLDPGSDLIFWFGPDNISVANQSKSNGNFWIAADGSYRSNVRRRSSAFVADLTGTAFTQATISLPSVRGTAGITGSASGLSGVDVSSATVTNLTIQVELRRGTTVLATQTIPVPTSGTGFDQSFQLDGLFFNATFNDNNTSKNYDETTSYNIRARLQGTNVTNSTLGTVRLEIVGLEISDV